jgi:hypothetical protein
MRPLRQFAAAILLLSLTSCTTGDCARPENWTLATSLEPPTVAYTPSPVFYARETNPGVWSWQIIVRRSADSQFAGTYERLLKEVALTRTFNPQPLLVFKFADGQTCANLNAARQGIAKAAGCSKDGRPCIEGSPDQLPYVPECLQWVERRHSGCRSR